MLEKPHDLFKLRFLPYLAKLTKDFKMCNYLHFIYQYQVVKAALALEEKKITFKMPSDCMLGSSFAIELILIASVKSVS